VNQGTLRLAPPDGKSEMAMPRAALARRDQAILAADVVGYVRLTEAAEEETHSRLRGLRVGMINPTIVNYRGRVVKNTGDGFLAVFDSSVDAVRCTMELQNEIITAERPHAPDRRITFRMGLNVGPIIVEPEDVYGADVNIAVRLEQVAPPEGVVVSAEILEKVTPRVDLSADDLGPIRLKHLSRTVHAYSLRLPGSDQAPAAVSPRAPKPAKAPSIAVLPFRSSGADPYFGEGIIDDIILALGSIRGLLVISRTSALTYRKKPVDIHKVGQELGVRYVLTGSVRKTGDQLRITAELADTASGAIVWSDRYDGNLSELFDLQDRIATRIVWSIAPHVRELELKRALRKRPENMNAYDLVMQGVDLLYRMSFTEFSTAGAILQRAIEADRNYAMAYAYSALWYVHWIVQGWTHDLRADSLEAARLAQAAVDRDPADGFALAIQAHVTSLLLKDHKSGMVLFDRALEIAPGNAMAWTMSSGVYSYEGDSAVALERAEKGLRLSPADTQAFFYLSFLTLAHYVNGTYEEALIWGYKGMSLNPRLCANMRWLCGSLVALGRNDEARSIGQSLLQVQPRFRLSEYAQLCPLRSDMRSELLSRLRAAGLPD